MSITILMAHKADGHGATFVCPFTFTPSKSIDLAILFVFADDLDIIHVDMKQRETINEVYAALAASWNNLLMATGDTLNPDKCFYHMWYLIITTRRSSVGYMKIIRTIATTTTLNCCF